jgi:REP element-mobilizing transposase RayT
VPQSYAAVHLHIVFSTRHREPVITPELAPRLQQYLAGTARDTGCRVITSGGMPDHIHLLVSLGREVTIAELLRTLKAGSSRWVHDTFPDRAGFVWQTGYGAFSVSQSQVAVVTRYIDRQEEHHRVRTFQDEFRELLRVHGIEFDERYIWE